MSLNEGPEKTFVYRYNNSSPRYSVRTTMLSLYKFESFSGFHSQAISITLLQFLICHGKSCLNPNAKIVILLMFCIIESKNYNLNPLLFLGSYADCRKPCRSFSHCSLNHSLIGCLFIVSTNLLLSTELFSTLKTSFLISNLRLCSSE